MNTVQERPAVPVEIVDDAGEQASIALQATREVPDWERLIEAGIVPALALGAERRMRR
jgi:hypothetical protein